MAVAREDGFVEAELQRPKRKTSKGSAANNPSETGPVRQLPDVIWRQPE
jgi:hypothetical protein